MTLEITVKADYNDADYIYKTTEITKEKLSSFKPLFEAIGDKGRHHNWETGDHSSEPLTKQYPNVSEDLLEEFDCDYVPRSEYGVHTIESITLKEVVHTEELI